MLIKEALLKCLNGDQAKVYYFNSSSQLSTNYLCCSSWNCYKLCTHSTKKATVCINGQDDNDKIALRTNYTVTSKNKMRWQTIFCTVEHLHTIRKLSLWFSSSFFSLVNYELLNLKKVNCESSTSFFTFLIKAIMINGLQKTEKTITSFLNTSNDDGHHIKHRLTITLPTY